MSGLLSGIVAVISGSYLFINGVFGKTSFFASVFGNEVYLSDAAPGTVLFVIGLFLIIVTRYTKIKVSTDNGGNFIGSPVSAPQNDQPKNLLVPDDVDLNKLGLFVYSTLIDSYRPGQHKLGGLYALYLKFPAKSPCGVMLKGITQVYDADLYKDSNDVCSVIFRHLRLCKCNNCSECVRSIEEILYKGIWDTEKNNRLRERFHWAWRYNFKDEAKLFYEKNLVKFIEENLGNEEICVEILNDIYYYENELTGNITVASFLKKYFLKNPQISEKLYPSAREFSKQLIDNV